MSTIHGVPEEGVARVKATTTVAFVERRQSRGVVEVKAGVMRIQSGGVQDVLVEAREGRSKWRSVGQNRRGQDRVAE